VTKKRIEDERLQIGVLKSLGYSKYSIALSYLVYPILGSIIGGILGFTLGELLSGKVTSLFLSYYNVPLNNFTIDFKYLSECIMIPIIILSALSYLIALIMLRKKPLALLKEGSNLKVNLLSKFINFITKLLPFKQRFKYSLASRSFGKLLIVTITSFGVGMLITLTLIGANLFNNVIDLSFKGMKYDYIAYMNNYYTDKIENSDAILTTSLTLESIKDKDENLKNIDVLSDDDTISFTGIDNDAVTIELTNDDEDIKYMLEDNNVVVSKNMKEYLNLEIGDTLYFKYNDSILSYKIVGFSNELMSFNVYVNRSVLSENLGFSDSVYNVIYSNDTKYQSLSKLSDEELRKIVYVMSLKDLKANIEKQMDRFNASIYLVIAFAIVMAFVIIAVIANIIVEENKKTISLMKVMGYKNKEVSSIVLNIYTPIVIISYLLSIKAMISLLKWIVSKLIADMEITIPIALSFKDAMIGLIGLLMAYYVAIAISRKVLNKVPLAIALKRE
jgi:ABC-type lipoprotein release transport system permease subunit